MGVKLFTFLGTNDYKETEYFFGDESSTKSYKSRFTQEAIVKTLEIPELEVIVFTTEEAYQKNWIPKDEGLKSKLENANVKCKNIMIPQGKTNEEIWQIFNLVYENIEENDEIYVDITHSLRSIPVVFMSVLNHAKITKGCHIKRILYGAYEAKEEDNRSPIFDLILFDKITDWSFGVDQLISTGESEKFCSAAEETLKPLKSQTQGKDELVSLTEKCAKKIKEFYTDLKLAQGKPIQKNGVELKNLLDEIKELNKDERLEIKPFYDILEKIENQVDFFEENNLVENILGCAKLCVKFGMYQQAYTFLLENIINYICLEAGLDWNKLKDRESVANVIGSKNLAVRKEKNYEKGQESGDKETSDKETELQNLKDKLGFITEDIAKYYDKLGQYRNTLNHAGFRENPLSKKKVLDEINSFISEFEKLFLEKEILEEGGKRACFVRNN